MIRHYVAWRLAAGEAEQKQADARFVADTLEALVGRVPGLDALSVRPDVAGLEGNWDLVLVADFASIAALEAYLTHPEHVAAVAQVKPLFAARAAVDVEI
jgi:hypothetical protein